MPTTIAVVSAGPASSNGWSDVLSLVRNGDFLAVVAFTAIGLSLAIGLAMVGPFSGVLAAAS